MQDRRPYLYFYIGIAVIGMFIGGKCCEYIICGLLALVLIVILSELFTLIKLIIAKTGGLADVLLFIFSFFQILSKNSDLGFCLLYGSLGFSILYSPYIRITYGRKKT